MLPPIIDKNVELAADDERRFKPIAAAQPFESTSVNYDPLFHYFIRIAMREGQRKDVRERLEQAFELIKCMQLEKYYSATNEEERAAVELNPHVILRKAIENCQPVLTVQKVFRAGFEYRVPVPCSPKRSRFLAVRWIVEAAEATSQRKMRRYRGLAIELLAAAANEGKAVAKKIDLHRVCEENRAYAHFRM